MQIQERGKDYFVIETSQWVAAISDGLCIARYVYGRYGEPRVEIDSDHAGSTSDIKNRNEFLGATDVEVAERIADGTYTVADLDEWFTNL